MSTSFPRATQKLGRNDFSMTGTAENEVHARANRELVDALRRSKLFRDYERVFAQATGLPLALRPLEYWQLAHHGKRNENPFCALLAENPKTLAVCLETHEEMIRHTGDLPTTVTCPFGLTETAVPLKLGQETIGYLRVGQVLRRSPSQADTNKAGRAIEHAGASFTPALRQAWEKNPFIPGERYNAIVRLLTFFAEQLSALSNQLLVEEQNREPTIVSKARRYIEEHKAEKISLPDSGRGRRRQCLPFLQALSQEHRPDVYRLPGASSGGGGPRAVAQPEPAHQRDRLRRRLSIAHPIQSHFPADLRAVAEPIPRAAPSEDACAKTPPPEISLSQEAPRFSQ